MKKIKTEIKLISVQFMDVSFLLLKVRLDETAYNIILFSTLSMVLMVFDVSINIYIKKSFQSVASVQIFQDLLHRNICKMVIWKSGSFRNRSVI